MDSNDWQCQVDEVIALEAICGDDFRVLSCSALPDVEEVSGELLAACTPADPVHLDCDLMVHMELPERGLQLMVGVDTGPRVDTSQGTLDLASATNGIEDHAAAVSVMDFPVGLPVRHLPPITLRLQLPPDYPSTSIPTTSLHAVWLSPAMVADLEGQLSLLWSQQGPGGPIIFTWQDWLRGDALRHLGLHDRLVIAEPALAPQGSGDLNGTAGPGRRAAVPAEQVAMGLLRYNAVRDAEEFAAALWLCGICYEQVPGTKCSRLPECGHYYCQACLGEHCRIQVRDGAVDNLRCPTPDCRKHIPPYVVRDLLPQDEFERWEQIVLQRTLDSMTDAAYCPRCSTLTLEESDHCAQCPKCLFVFCGLCLGSWHVGEPCMDSEARLRVLESHGGAGNQRQREKLIQDLMSERLLKSTSKPCPNCGMAIQKTEGCNKMVCGNCQAYFCWRCGKQIKGYEHYQDGGCVLFDQTQIDAWNAMMNQRHGNEEMLHRRARIDVAVQMGGRLTRCPACGQENAKEGQNNSIRCWSCNSSFCYLCRMVLRGKGAVGAHFLKACKQHTTD